MYCLLIHTRFVWSNTSIYSSLFATLVSHRARKSTVLPLENAIYDSWGVGVLIMKTLPQGASVVSRYTVDKNGRKEMCRWKGDECDRSRLAFASPYREESQRRDIFTRVKVQSFTQVWPLSISVLIQYYSIIVITLLTVANGNGGVEVAAAAFSV
jgi:hypothetical protein